MYKLQIKPSETLHTKFGNARIQHTGYYVIRSRKEGNNGKLLHRLIFEDFYGPIPENCHIHHKDGNKTNNCILNLQLLTGKEHHSLHMKGENHPMYGRKGEDHPLYGKHRSEETRKKISKAKNSSGYFRVYKYKRSDYKQGFTWAYVYPVDGKKKVIYSVDIYKLEQKVREKQLPWSIL